MESIKSRSRHAVSKPKIQLAAAATLLIMLAALLGMLVRPAAAQTYVFWIDRSTADLYVNPDGTVSIEYTYLFRNDPSADPIDAIDIGVPTTRYDLSSVSAEVNGQPVTSIEESPYVKPGIALNLGRMSIPPGETGEVKVRIGTVNNMIFKANTQESEPYASFQFTPNYFGSSFVVGETDMTVTLHLPPGLNQDEPRYFNPENWPGSDEPNEIGFDEQDRVFYRWTSSRASSSQNYIFGSAFPARMVPAAALVTEVPFRLDFDTLCPAFFCLGFFGFMALTIYGAIVGDRKRKLDYLPPKLSVEGNGIKRGLTAIEAAVVMQQPMDKILTMILFSVLKKGGASVVSHNPIQLKVVQPTVSGLQPYEDEFLQAMMADQKGAQRARLQTVMTNLVKSVSEKMRGFSRKDTIAYYQGIMQKAWEQVEAANTPELKMKNFDEAMDWTMLDQKFDDRTRRTFGPQPVFMPYWWGRFDPRASGTGTMGMPSGPNVSTSQNAPPQGVNLPSLPGSEIAGSMVAGMQNFSANVIGDLTSFTGGVTNKTNPAPKPPTSSRGGGGGGGGGRSCACACACAGCACACAGGGR
jgi:hypothetical protein